METINLRTDPIPEIEVTGERPLDERTVSSGLREIAITSPPREPRPQFADPLCLHVQGLGSDLSDRLRHDAERGAPALSWTLETSRWRSAYGGQDGADAAAVDGLLLDNNPAASVPIAREAWSSRLRNNFGLARTGAFVVFDVRQLADVRLDQLADYATMQLLTTPRRQIDFDDLAADTILTLFHDGPWAAPQQLTRLDKSYLHGLYAMRPNEWGARLYALAKAANEDLSRADRDSGTAECRSKEG